MDKVYVMMRFWKVVKVTRSLQEAWTWQHPTSPWGQWMREMEVEGKLDPPFEPLPSPGRKSNRQLLEEIRAEQERAYWADADVML